MYYDENLNGRGEQRRDRTGELADRRWREGRERERKRKGGREGISERDNYGLYGTSLMRPAASCRNRVVTEAMKAPSPPPPVRQ